MPLRRGPKPPRIVLTPDERAVLERIVRAATSAQRDVLRARIVLLAADDLASRAIAKLLGVEQNTVGKWRRRFAEKGLEGLQDAPRSGRPPRRRNE